MSVREAVSDSFGLQPSSVAWSLLTRQSGEEIHCPFPLVLSLGERIHCWLSGVNLIRLFLPVPQVLGGSESKLNSSNNSRPLWVTTFWIGKFLVSFPLTGFKTNDILICKNPYFQKAECWKFQFVFSNLGFSGKFSWQSQVTIARQGNLVWPEAGTRMLLTGSHQCQHQREVNINE